PAPRPARSNERDVRAWDGWSSVSGEEVRRRRSCLITVVGRFAQSGRLCWVSVTRVVFGRWCVLVAALRAATRTRHGRTEERKHGRKTGSCCGSGAQRRSLARVTHHASPITQPRDDHRRSLATQTAKSESCS